MGANRKGGVEQQHALRGPRFETSVSRRNAAEVAAQLLEDVQQTRRNRDARVHRETQTVRLAGAGVRILAEDDDPRVGERRCVERVEHLIVRRVDNGP